METKYRIFDTFNRRVVSNHRSLRTTVIAQDKFSKAVRRANGQNSYIPTIVEYTATDGTWLKLPIDDLHDAQMKYVHGW